MIKVKFYNSNEIDDFRYKYAVIMTKYQNQWLFVKHRERSTWEIPGGRREADEPILITAERELVEETGATLFKLYPVCAYSVISETDESFGHLYYAEVYELGDDLEHEIIEVKKFEKVPDNLTYPLIQPFLFEKVNEFINAR